MKKLYNCTNRSRTKKAVCTVSAAALMLGVSSAATVGLHFQENYCNGSGLPASGYSGFPVTLTAFGVQPGAWENLTPMNSGYQGCAGPLGYTFSEVIDTTTSTNGLNPLPNGSLSVTWFGPTANFSQFAGYAGIPPYYCDVTPPNTEGLPTNATGEMQVYCTFMRDGVNFGPGSSGGDNNQPGYSVDISGLKSLFTNSPFVVELMASGDSIETLTNAFVIDVTNSTTNSVSYPSTPLPDNTEGTSYYQGSGGGLSTGSAALNTDHIKIMSAPPQHVAGQFNHAGTICGFIMTDKPVVSMYPQSIPVAGPGDSILLNPYAIGVPPLSYQWRFNGVKIAAATNSSYSISNVNTLAIGGNYDLIVTNLYGSATSMVSSVAVDRLTQSSASNIVYDSNPANPQHDGMNMGETWQASNSDGTITRTGVMAFDPSQTNGISVPENPSFDSSTGTVTFWMRSPGSGGNYGAIFSHPIDNTPSEFILAQFVSAGNLYFQGPPASGNVFISAGVVSNNRWHFVALTFDQSASGGVALYIDGALDTTNANGGSWSWVAGQPLQIGYSSDSSFIPYNGLLDDVRYYSAELSASQIGTIYSAGALVDTNDLQLQFNFTAAPGKGIILNWLESSAVLQSAPTVTGPWKDLPAITSPYTIVPAATQQYFRYRYVPQSLVSNPYLM